MKRAIYTYDVSTQQVAYMFNQHKSISPSNAAVHSPIFQWIQVGFQTYPHAAGIKTKTAPRPQVGCQVRLLTEANNHALEPKCRRVHDSSDHSTQDLNVLRPTVSHFYESGTVNLIH